MFKKNIDNLIIIINIIFFSYYAIQLLVFTDEFALNNLGFFNHAVAGLSEIIGIIFISFVIAYTIIIFRGAEKQLPFMFVIFLFQLLAALNFWRYVLRTFGSKIKLLAISIEFLAIKIYVCGFLETKTEFLDIQM